jgi:hypothetical protein
MIVLASVPIGSTVTLHPLLLALIWPTMAEVTLRCLGIWILLNSSDHSFAVDAATAPVFLRPPKLPYVPSEFTTGQNHLSLLHVSLLPVVRAGAVCIFCVFRGEKAFTCGV